MSSVCDNVYASLWWNGKNQMAAVIFYFSTTLDILNIKIFFYLEIKPQVFKWLVKNDIMVVVGGWWYYR